MARADGIGASGHPDAPGAVVERSVGTDDRPRHRPVPRVALRAAGRHRHRLRRRLPEPGAGIPAHRRRAVPARHLPGTQPRQRRDVRPVVRPADPGGGHPDAHAGGSRGRARLRGGRPRVQGGGVRRLRATPVRGAGRQGPRGGPLRLLARPVRGGLGPRLRPGVGQGPGARGLDRLPLRVHRDDALPLHLQLRLQPPVDAGRRPAVVGQIALPRWGHPPVPRAQLRLPRGRCGMGRLPLQRHRRALGEAQSGRPPAPPRPGPRRPGPDARDDGPVRPGRPPPPLRAHAATGRARGRTGRMGGMRASSGPRTSRACSPIASTSGARPTTRSPPWRSTRRSTRSAPS